MIAVAATPDYQSYALLAGEHDNLSNIARIADTGSIAARG
jgi:hypothetical protein